MTMCPFCQFFLPGQQELWNPTEQASIGGEPACSDCALYVGYVGATPTLIDEVRACKDREVQA